MDFSTLRAEEEKENGVWIDFDDAKILIGSATSPAYRKALRKAAAKVPAHIARSKPERMEQITREAMAKHVLLDWTGVTDNGKEVEPTLENRIKYLSIPSFLDWVSDQAMDLSNFQTEGETKSVEAIKGQDPLAD